MSKSSTQQLVKDEQKILDVLKTNANENTDIIAKKCRFSRQKVRRIIKKLEKNKAIWGYTAVCDDESYNLKHFTMLTKRTKYPLTKRYAKKFLRHVSMI